MTLGGWHGLGQFWLVPRKKKAILIENYVNPALSNAIWAVIHIFVGLFRQSEGKK